MSQRTNEGNKMVLRTSIFAACWVMLVAGAAARADYVLDVLPPNVGPDGPDRFLIAGAPSMTWTSTNLVSANEVIGKFEIKMSAVTSGTLSDSTLLPLAGDSTVTYNDLYLSLNLDITRTLLAGGTYSYATKIAAPTAGNPTLQIAGVVDDAGSSVVTFANTNVAYLAGINLNNATTPIGFAFSNNGSGYFNGPKENAIIVQVQYLNTTSATDPTPVLFTESNFFIATGQTTFSSEPFKIDVFAVSLPLPPVLITGLMGLGGVVAATLLYKMRSLVKTSAPSIC